MDRSHPEVSPLRAGPNNFAGNVEAARFPPDLARPFVTGIESKDSTRDKGLGRGSVVCSPDWREAVVGRRHDVVLECCAKSARAVKWFSLRRNAISAAMAQIQSLIGTTPGGLRAVEAAAFDRGRPFGECAARRRLDLTIACEVVP